MIFEEQMQLQLSKIFIKAKDYQFKSKQEKVEFLAKHYTPALGEIFKYMYNDIEWALPEGDPPYKPDTSNHDNYQLYSALRKIPRLFFFGGHPTLKPLRREQLFIELLESIAAEDAEMLLAIKSKKFKSYVLTRKLVEEVLPNLLDPVKKEKGNKEDTNG